MNARQRRSWCLALGLVAAATAGTLAAFLPQHARAGSRDFVLVVVRADDGTDPESEACVARVRRRLSQTVERTRNVSRAVAEGRVGGSLDGFMDWPPARLRLIVPDPTGDLGAVVVIDCRPGAQVLDVVVLASAPTQRLSLRQVPVAAAAERFAGVILEEWQWLGFTY